MLFVDDSPQGYVSVGVGMFKDSSLLGTFPLPPPETIFVFSLIHMIYLVTNGSLRFYDPWLVLIL